MDSATATASSGGASVNSSSADWAGQDPVWEEIVSWAETDLRRQVEQTLSISSPVRPSTIIESTLFWAAANRDRLLQTRSHPRNFLAGVARFIRYEKFRQVGRQRRTPPNGGSVIPLTDSIVPRVQDSAWQQEIQEAVTHLPREMQDLIRALYWDLRTCREYARQLGQPEKRVQRLHAAALRRLGQLIRPGQTA